jgi:hypothetical protein
MTPIPKVESSLGGVRVHSLTLSYTPGSMRCDSQASFLACNFASPYFGRKPKAKVTIASHNVFGKGANSLMTRGAWNLFHNVLANDGEVIEN